MNGLQILAVFCVNSVRYLEFKLNYVATQNYLQVKVKYIVLA